MIIFRYLCKEIFTALLATTLILLIVFITNQFVHYLNDAADGKITIQAVMEVMSLQVPFLLGYLLPLGLFLGIVLTIGRFCVDHEMVVLSACGMSRAQLVTMILSLSVIVMGVVAWLMLSVEPKMQWYRAKILADLVATASLEKIMPGRFQPLGDNGMVFYAAQVGEHHHNMQDVFLAKRQAAPSGMSRWDLVAGDAAGELNTREDGYFVLFKKGFRYVGIPGQLKFDVVQFGQYGIRLNTPTPDITNRVDAMPTQKLWNLRKQDLKAAAELQWRLSMPISVMIFALLAVPLSQVSPRKGKFAQVLPAILIYIVYANLMFMGRAWLEKGLVSQGVGLWWVNGSLLILAIVLFLGQVRWRPLLIFRRRK